MSGPVYALTILQPWCHAITHGSKRVENRSWAPPRRLDGALLALHAGKRYDTGAWFPRGHRLPDPAEIGPVVPLSAVVGVAKIAGWHQARSWCCRPWAEPGMCHWILAHVQALPEPVPCRGHQRLWKLPGEVEAGVLGQLPIAAGDPGKRARR